MYASLTLGLAVMTLPIWGQDDIRDTVRYKDVMKGYDIGPNEEIHTFNFERGDDATISSKAVLHHVLVPHGVADITFLC